MYTYIPIYVCTSNDDDDVAIGQDVVICISLFVGIIEAKGRRRAEGPEEVVRCLLFVGRWGLRPDDDKAEAESSNPVKHARS